MSSLEQTALDDHVETLVESRLYDKLSMQFTQWQEHLSHFASKIEQVTRDQEELSDEDIISIAKPLELAIQDLEEAKQELELVQGTDADTARLQKFRALVERLLLGQREIQVRFNDLRSSACKETAPYEDLVMSQLAFCLKALKSPS